VTLRGDVSFRRSDQRSSFVIVVVVVFVVRRCVVVVVVVVVVVEVKVVELRLRLFVLRCGYGGVLARYDSSMVLRSEHKSEVTHMHRRDHRSRAGPRHGRRLDE